MTEKMQLLFAHIACAALIVACFWLSQTVLKDQPELGKILIGLGAGLWGKIGFEPARVVVESMLERLTPAQVRKVKSIYPIPPASEPQPMAATPIGPMCVRCSALLTPSTTGPLCDGCRLDPTHGRGAA